MGKPGNTGIRRIIAATFYSAQGFRHAWQHEAAFRQEVALSVVLLPAAFWLGRSPFEELMLVVSLLLTLLVELLNSAIEATLDRIGAEHHVLVGRAKDMGSAAVFVSLVIAAAVWLTVAYSRFGM